MRVEVSVNIEAEPARAWAVMTDVEAWPEWTASVTAVQRLDAGELRPGAEARIKQPRLPAATWRVTAVDPGRAFTWEAQVRGVRSVATHRIEPAGAGARVTLVLEQHGLAANLFAPFTRPMVRKYVEMEAAGLKRRSEEQPAVLAV